MTRVLVALDLPDLEEAESLARRLVDGVDGFKVGMELLMAAGPAAIEATAAIGKPVFVDAKLHDIPNTVGRAATRIKSAGARWVTVHAAGGKEMIAAATTGMGGHGVVAVTMLTSLSGADLADIGVNDAPPDYVREMAGLSFRAGAEGVVCSPREIAIVKSAHPDLKVFSPGIRPEGASTDDQKRVATPERAASDGADYLVIGRPITMSDDPVAAARLITSSLGQG
ncbi:MAG: orotidine-5'-phosphate decarboxylase [Actinomycetota bacterium]